MSRDFLEDLGRELDRAAAGLVSDERSVGEGRRWTGALRRLVPLAAVTAILALSAVVGVTLVGSPDAEREVTGSGEEARGTVGGPPTHLYGDRPPEDFLDYARTPTVLAIGERDGFRYELVGYRYGDRNERGGPSRLCIDVAIGNEAFGCASYSGHVQGGSYGGDESLVTGATTQPVSRIEVSYSIRSEPGRVDGILARADDREVLRRVGIPKPFTFYVARIPGRPDDYVVTAYDAKGQQVWRAEPPVPPEHP